MVSRLRPHHKLHVEVLDQLLEASLRTAVMLTARFVKEICLIPRGANRP